MPIQTFCCDVAVKSLPPQVKTLETALLAALIQQGISQPTLLRWAVVAATPTTLTCEGAYTTE